VGGRVAPARARRDRGARAGRAPGVFAGEPPRHADRQRAAPGARGARRHEQRDDARRLVAPAARALGALRKGEARPLSRQAGSRQSRRPDPRERDRDVRPPPAASRARGLPRRRARARGRRAHRLSLPSSGRATSPSGSTSGAPTCSAATASATRSLATSWACSPASPERGRARWFAATHRDVEDGPTGGESFARPELRVTRSPSSHTPPTRAR
jgi:hypothetical protein